MYSQQYEMDEGSVKRGLFKSAKSGNVAEFEKFMSFIPLQKKRLQFKCKRISLTHTETHQIF
jgi:hypothetical protein